MHIKKGKRACFSIVRVVYYAVDSKQERHLNMAAPAPISYYVEFQTLNDQTRPVYLHELAVHGAKHIVLTSPLIRMIMDTPAFLKTVQQELAAEGLTFCDVHAPYAVPYDLNCPFEELRPFLTARFRTSMELAASLGLDTMTFHTGHDGADPAIPREKHIERVCSMLDQLLPDAERLGITLCIENGMSQNNSTDVLLTVRDHFDSDHLGFCFDAGHANLMEKGIAFPGSSPRIQWGKIGREPKWESVQEKMKRMLPHIVNCHLHDNLGEWDQHTLPGRGTVDWKLVTGMLKKAPRLRAIQCEALSIRNGFSVAELVRTMENLFDQPEEEK